MVAQIEPARKPEVEAFMNEHELGTPRDVKRREQASGQAVTAAPDGTAKRSRDNNREYTDSLLQEWSGWATITLANHQPNSPLFVVRTEPDSYCSAGLVDGWHLNDNGGRVPAQFVYEVRPMSEQPFTFPVVSIPTGILMDPAISKESIVLYSYFRFLYKSPNQLKAHNETQDWWKALCTYMGGQEGYSKYYLELKHANWLTGIGNIPDVLIITFESPDEGADWYRRRDLIRKYQGSTPATDNPGHVYLVKSVTGHYKIGRSKNARSRARTFGIALPFEIELEHVINCRDYIEVETLLHDLFWDRHVNGEWFALTFPDIISIRHAKEL